MGAGNSKPEAVSPQITDNVQPPPPLMVEPSAQAAGAPGMPPPSMGMPGPPMEPMPEEESKGFSMCPGTFEELHKPCKDVMPPLFEGIKLVANNGLSQNFQISHTFTLNSQSSGYRYGTTYVGSKHTSPTEAYPVMLGEMDTSGSLNAQIIHEVADSLRTKCIVQTEKTEWEAIQMDAAYRGKDFTASTMVVNPDLLTGSGVYLLQYLQSFTPQFALGSELLIRRSASMGQQTIFSVAGQLRSDRWRLAATVGSGAIHASYVLKCNKTLQLCAELESSPRMRQNTLTLGYQLDVPQANFSFRGQVDSNWTVASMMEKRLVPYPFTLQLCAVMNHQAQATRVGVGLTVG